MPRHYPALIEPAASGTGFGVLFTDFPGCVAARFALRDPADA